MKTAQILAAGLLIAAPGSAFADVTVGLMAPLTGPVSTFGAQYAGSLKLFEASQAKLRDKEKIKFVVYDTQGDLTQTISLTRKLISSDDVVLILGPLLSGEAEVAFPIAVQGKTPIISPTASKPGLAASNRPYAFTYAASANQKIATQVDKWLSLVKEPIKNVVVIMDTKDAISKFEGSTGYPQVLKQHNIKVLDVVSIQTGDLDFSAPVTRAKSSNPDGIVLATLANEGGNIMREMRKQDMKQPVLSGVGNVDPQFIKLAGPSADGVVLATEFFPLSDDPVVKKWVADYQAANGIGPTSVAAQLYELLDVARFCITSQGVSGKDADLQADREKIRSCIGSLKDYTVPLSGKVSITDTGEALRTPQILLVKDSKFTLLR